MTMKPLNFTKDKAYRLKCDVENIHFADGRKSELKHKKIWPKGTTFFVRWEGSEDMPGELTFMDNRYSHLHFSTVEDWPELRSAMEEVEHTPETIVRAYLGGDRNYFVEFLLRSGRMTQEQFKLACKARDEERE